jgi:hypothetical protein
VSRCSSDYGLFSWTSSVLECYFSLTCLLLLSVSSCTFCWSSSHITELCRFSFVRVKLISMVQFHLFIIKLITRCCFYKKLVFSCPLACSWLVPSYLNFGKLQLTFCYYSLSKLLVANLFPSLLTLASMFRFNYSWLVILLVFSLSVHYYCLNLYCYC